MTDPTPEAPPPPPPLLISWTPDGAIGFGWKMIQKDPTVVLATFIFAVCSSLVTLPGEFLQISADLSKNHDAIVQARIVYWSLFVLSLPIDAWLTIGLWRYVLKAARGEPAGIGDLFSGGPFLSMFGAMLLVYVGVVGGVVMCIVPGVILGLGWMLWEPLVVDRGCGALESLKESWRLTTGHRVQLFVLALFSMGVVLAGILACCVGVFVAMPIVLFAKAYVYLRLTGQPVAEPVR